MPSDNDNKGSNSSSAAAAAARAAGNGSNRNDQNAVDVISAQLGINNARHEGEEKSSNAYLTKPTSIGKQGMLPILSLNLKDNKPLRGYTTTSPIGARAVFIGSYNAVLPRAPILIKLPAGLEEELGFVKVKNGYAVEIMYCLQEELKYAHDVDSSVRPHFAIFTSREMREAKEGSLTKSVAVTILGDKSSIEFKKNNIKLHDNQVSPNNFNFKRNNIPYFRTQVISDDNKTVFMTIHRIVNHTTVKAIEEKIQNAQEVTLERLPIVFAEFKLPELQIMKEACEKIAKPASKVDFLKTEEEAERAEIAAEEKFVAEEIERMINKQNRNKVILLKKELNGYLKHLDPEWKPDVQPSQISHAEMEEAKNAPLVGLLNEGENVDDLSLEQLFVRKKIIASSMYTILNNDDFSDSQKVDKVRVIVENKKNQEILATGRDSAGVKILKVLASIFSIGIAIAAGLWSVKGEKLSGAIKTTLDSEEKEPPSNIDRFLYVRRKSK